MRPLLLFAIYSVAFAGVTIFRATADANNPAHELAQKFAAEDAPKAEAAKIIAAEPAAAQPIATKPVVANPANAKPAPSKPSPANAANTKPAHSGPPATPAPTAAAPAKVAPKLAQAKAPRPPAPGPDYEKDMLDAARAEAEARQKLQTEPEELAPSAATVVAAPEPAAPPEKPATPPASIEAAAPQPAPANAPAPAPATTPQIKIEAKVNVPAPSAPAVISRPDGAPRATILAVLTQNAGRGGRAITPPDPIICLADICYVSAGLNAEAKPISRADALSTKNTVTSGAGACKGVSRCAFRGVSMKPGDEVQIIDLGLVGHDRREPADVLPDKSCHVDDGDLVCEHPVTAPDYRIWVVPETIAASAGPGALEAALADDLPEEDIARAEDK